MRDYILKQLDLFFSTQNVFNIRVFTRYRRKNI